MNTETTARLLISCDDKPGIVATISNFLYHHGANPYRKAAERGVIIIGATAHYVTEDLDEGSIIEQDVKRVSHRHNVEELKEIGRDIERNVLARAVRWHAEDRILLHQNRTVVFAEW